VGPDTIPMQSDTDRIPQDFQRPVWMARQPILLSSDDEDEVEETEENEDETEEVEEGDEEEENDEDEAEENDGDEEEDNEDDLVGGKDDDAGFEAEPGPGKTEFGVSMVSLI
jgi:hypothetical protein